MDNMAYLQTIAKRPPEKNRGGGFDILEFLKKLLNIKTAIIAGIVIVGIIVASVVTNSVSQVTNRDRDLLIQGYYASKYLTESIKGYNDRLLSSDVRTMNATLIGILSSVQNDNRDHLKSFFSIEVDGESEGAIAQSEMTRINSFTNTLETAKISGLLDRTFLREIKLQITIIKTYEDECNVVSESAAVKKTTSTNSQNLANLLAQYEAYKDPTVAEVFDFTARREYAFC